jgi:hypothetical protein
MRVSILEFTPGVLVGEVKLRSKAGWPPRGALGGFGWEIFLALREGQGWRWTHVHAPRQRVGSEKLVSGYIQV